MFALTTTLAQEAAPQSWFNQIFWMTLAAIFLTAIIGTIIRRYRKDRCLKLMGRFHVTLELTSGRTIWGFLRVFSQGVEVLYDAPYRTGQGLIKNSYLLYETEMGNLLTIARYVGDLAENDRCRRDKQVAARFQPSFPRRTLRRVYNFFNMIRDAFSRALSAFIGQVAKTGSSQFLATQQSSVDQIGQTLITAAGNAYEPMLERYIGKPVVLELLSPADPAKRTIELPGYLAEYSEKYIALFNVEQPLSESFELTGSESIERGDLKIILENSTIAITNLHDVPLIIQQIHGDRTSPQALGITLTNAATARFKRCDTHLTIRLARAPRIDIVCPRQYAVVRHASLHEMEPEDQATRLAPSHEDRKTDSP